MANTKAITDKVERKKAKRIARKKAAPESAAHLCPRLGEAQGEEAGTRSVETLIGRHCQRTKAPADAFGWSLFLPDVRTITKGACHTCLEWRSPSGDIFTLPHTTGEYLAFLLSASS